MGDDSTYLKGLADWPKNDETLLTLTLGGGDAGASVGSFQELLRQGAYCDPSSWLERDLDLRKRKRKFAQKNKRVQ